MIMMMIGWLIGWLVVFWGCFGLGFGENHIKKAR